MNDNETPNVARLRPARLTVAGALVEAMERGMTSVLILGETPEGTFFIRASGNVTRKDALWLTEIGRKHAVEDDDE